MALVKFEKELEIYGEYDVVVLGGGPSGVSAAVSAAREGVRTLLVESQPCLGGMATGGLVGPFMTVYDRDGNEKIVGGIFDEIVERLKKYSAVIPPQEVGAATVYTSHIEKYHSHVTPFNSFYLEIVLDEMVRESGVELLCYTSFSDCIVENGKINYVVLNALEGMICVKGNVFIDCTGNAALAEAAGAPTYKGEEESGIPQPGTLMFEVGGVDDKEYTALAARPERPVKAYKTPTSGRYKVNHYHVYDVDAANSKSMTDAHSKARYQVLDAYSVLKDKTRGFEEAELLQVAHLLGIRESRHIEGEYKITVRDVSEGTRFEDRIAVYGFGMDIHNRKATEFGNFKIEVAERYYIPYRSLLPKSCKNLLVAGKTLSCQSQAVGGMRCMPAVMSIGQAAGIAAAMAVGANSCPASVDISELQNKIKATGGIID